MWIVIVLQITWSLISTQLKPIRTHYPLRNPYLIVVLGDFNAQAKGWYPLGKTTYEGTRIDGFTSQLGLEQLIHKLTHIIWERSSYIDLVLASQTNLVVESGVPSSLHQNCLHQKVFARFNLRVVFPPPYEREVWYCKKESVDYIRKVINGFQKIMGTIISKYERVYSMTWFIHLNELSKIPQFWLGD